MNGLVSNEVGTREGDAKVLSMCPRVGLTTTGLTGEISDCHSARLSADETMVGMALHIDEVVVGIGSFAVDNIAD